VAHLADVRTLESPASALDHGQAQKQPVTSLFILFIHSSIQSLSQPASQQTNNHDNRQLNLTAQGRTGRNHFATIAAFRCGVRALKSLSCLYMISTKIRWIGISMGGSQIMSGSASLATRVNTTVTFTVSGHHGPPRVTLTRCR
jgi:hypothetical protein